MSNASRGSYYKGRTKRWLIAKGYQVADMEVVRWTYRPDGQPMLPRKFDQFASDLVAMNAHAIVFIQVKGGQAARTGYFPDARRNFAAFTFPPHVKRFVVAWPPRAREPRIVDMSTTSKGVLHGPASSLQAQDPQHPARRSVPNAAPRRNTEVPQSPIARP